MEGKIFKRRTLTLKVIDYRPDLEKSLVEVLNGEYGTRKQGTKFLMNNEIIRKEVKKCESKQDV